MNKKTVQYAVCVAAACLMSLVSADAAQPVPARPLAPVTIWGGVVSDSINGQPVVGAQLTFVSTSTVKSVDSGVGGAYSIVLPAGRYLLFVRHPDFEAYDTWPDQVPFKVASKEVPEEALSIWRQRLNVRLASTKVTTVLVLRHAEPDYAVDPQDPPLSALGLARAQDLLRVAGTVPIKGAYATSLKRTQQTVQPLANQLGLVPVIDDSPTSVAARILADHRGHAVVVVAHEPTVPQIVQALGATPPIARSPTPSTTCAWWWCTDRAGPIPHTCTTAVDQAAPSATPACVPYVKAVAVFSAAATRPDIELQPILSKAHKNTLANGRLPYGNHD